LVLKPYRGVQGVNLLHNLARRKLSTTSDQGFRVTKIKSIYFI